MLDIPQDFFLEEIREDFTIDSTMKAYWAATLEVLREIAEICERHNLKWYTAYGTLLGTIRHEGYVPWDDDMDIWMLRKDYDKFIEIAQKELPEDYKVQSPLSDIGYSEFHACIFNSFTLSIEEERLRRFHGCPFAVGVDIFPLDYLPRNEEDREGQNTIFMVIGTAASIVKNEELNEDNMQNLQEAIDVLEDVCKVTIPRDCSDDKKKKEILSALFKLANQLCASFGEADGDELVMYMDYAKWPSKVFKKEWFAETVDKPFEGFLVPVPCGYDELLRKIYGNYHVRVRNVSQHDYPLYNKQVKYLREVTEDLENKVARLDELLANGK